MITRFLFYIHFVNKHAILVQKQCSVTEKLNVLIHKSLIMKKYQSIIAVFLLLLAVSCKKDQASEENIDSIIGKWKLIETYADPGDGSGRWNTVKSNKTLEFKNNGQIKVDNGSFAFGLFPGEKDESTYVLEPYTGVQTMEAHRYILKIQKLEHHPMVMFENGKLKIEYFCIEGCGERYEKIK